MYVKLWQFFKYKIIHLFLKKMYTYINYCIHSIRTLCLAINFGFMDNVPFRFLDTERCKV